MGVFETFFGLPLHPLVIHAAVVFIPLLIVAALVYVLVPQLRSRIAWAVVILAVIAPLSALLSKLSGDAFRARLARRHLASPAILNNIDVHRHYGTITLYVTIALGVVALAAVLVPEIRERNVYLIPLWVVTIGLAITTGYYVFRTGDTAAHIVWQGY
ncbi:hypothetical protein GCM10023322_53980 [Rugosimonospora acidiphila]|uniref:DUF2231 domain-containing protein n=1 Tax=Rugosimonospora acidiphila TaxID=556531 RepID=A0ABP9SA06_9ACTN